MISTFTGLDHDLHCGVENLLFAASRGYDLFRSIYQTGSGQVRGHSFHPAEIKIEPSGLKGPGVWHFHVPLAWLIKDILSVVVGTYKKKDRHFRWGTGLLP